MSACTYNWTIPIRTCNFSSYIHCTRHSYENNCELQSFDVIRPITEVLSLINFIKLKIVISSVVKGSFSCLWSFLVIFWKFSSLFFHFFRAWKWMYAVQSSAGFLDCRICSLIFHFGLMARKLWRNINTFPK